MKIKNDFVTNSSSCSFVLIGWQILKSSIENYDRLMNEEEFEIYLFDADYGAKAGHILIGERLVLSEYNDSEFEISIDQVMNNPTLLKIKDLLDISEGMKVFIGTTMC